MQHDREHWRQHTLAHRYSRLTQTTYCLQNGLHTRTYRTWSCKLEPEGAVKPVRSPPPLAEEGAGRGEGVCLPFAASSSGHPDRPNQADEHGGAAAALHGGGGAAARAGGVAVWPADRAIRPHGGAGPECFAPLETPVCRARRSAASSASCDAGSHVRLGDRRWHGGESIELDTNPVERAIRSVALERKNSLFAGSEGGASRWAIVAPWWRLPSSTASSPISGCATA